MRCLWGRTTLLMFACLTLLWPCCVGCAQGRHWRGEQIVASQSFVEGGSTIQVDFAAGDLDLSHSDVVSWVQASAHSVAVFYSRFPVARARVVIEPIAGDSDSIHGTTWGGMGGFPAVTRIRLAQHATKDDLKDDWVMTHEFVHTALPDLPDDQHWMEEGLATYVEPLADRKSTRLNSSHSS